MWFTFYEDLKKLAKNCPTHSPFFPPHLSKFEEIPIFYAKKLVYTSDIVDIHLKYM
jgi:hypothetical protein